MRILIGQPLHEEKIEQLECEIKNNNKIDTVIFPEGYLSSEINLRKACELAKKYSVNIITSYRHNNKDRAAIINDLGDLILERVKTPREEEIEIYEPSIVNLHGNTIGYLLCMEILKGIRDFEKIKEKIDFIVHPIGVGMFSYAQFEEWINEAKCIAKKYHTMIIGTSHADGSYRNCGISIPISYFIDSNGEEIFISKSDTRTRIVNLNTKEVEVF
jgi:hypothetical protein